LHLICACRSRSQAVVNAFALSVAEIEEVVDLPEPDPGMKTWRQAHRQRVGSR
jgi:hypothetical protein